MEALSDFIRSRKDLKAKSPEKYEYEIEVRLKNVINSEFEMFSQLNNLVTSHESLYEVKGSRSVTIKKINDDFFVKERISSRTITEYDAEIVLSLERRYREESGMALKVQRHKKRVSKIYEGFKVDATLVTSEKNAHYEIELEVLDDSCDINSVKNVLEGIRINAVSEVCDEIRRVLPGLNLRKYTFPKPVDITIKKLIKNYASGGSVSLKLDGVRSFIACYKKKIYRISTSGQESIVKSDAEVCMSLTVLDTELVDSLHYAFDVIILNGTVVAHEPLIKRINMIPRTCLDINNIASTKVVVAKSHYVFKSFNAFARYHQTLQRYMNDSRYDGIIYTHPRSYFDSVMRWKPRKTVDLICRDDKLMAYSKPRYVDSKLVVSQKSKKPSEGVVSEFLLEPKGEATFTRERRDKRYPNSITAVRQIAKIAGDEKNMLDTLKGCTISIMRSYHNDVKRMLLKEGYGHLLDIGSGFGGDVSKWDHYDAVTCIKPSPNNIKELKKRVGSSKKIKIIQTKVEHLRGFYDSVTTIACFFCITLINVDRFIKVIQRVYSSKKACVFLFTTMSKKYVTEFFEKQKIKEYKCNAYTIRIESNDSIYIDIPNTIVLKQTEKLIDVDDIIIRMKGIGFILSTRDRLVGHKFMSHDKDSNLYIFQVKYL